MATAIVYPRPPPTYNTLSQAQRAQMLRSSKKLGQILGSTPHILDDTDALPAAPPKRSTSLESMRSESAASTASSSSASSTHSGHSERAWRARFPERAPPLLRIGKLSSAQPGLPAIPGSPPAYHSQRSPTPSPQSSPHTSPGGSPHAPAFSIASDAALRRQKMRRLARRLGEGVPVHLVFPPATDSDDEDGVFVESPTSTCTPCERASLESTSEESLDERGALWERQTSRRSKFARASAAGPQYVVHYRDEGVHGREEVFGMLPCGKFAPIPEEEGIGYAF
ncbi:hypothetical protein PsYK624_085490 [Phanerochaete sordida]|uniref:Uncharacterized protein n=1 Tax=Phanerochaete sordida TaxID=48140 RepID=A0A9P3LEM1_9APHY|nr:hypothetical protein PsYK624_085490 [Phanerochaete sordida]